MAKAEKPMPAWLLAMGRQPLPPAIQAGGATYELAKPFKHDFFAATAMYEGSAGKVVLKVGRCTSLAGLPMTWLGRRMMRHEARLYDLSQGITGIPRVVGFVGSTGFVHEYIEGRQLARDDRPPDGFFEALSQTLDALHARDIAYVDLEKPENILLGTDGRPYLIDFQISWHAAHRWWGRSWLARRLLKVLQGSDRYHLLKHWRKLRPDQLSGERLAEAMQVPFWIRWHRAVFRPITLMRRQVLVWMGVRSSVKVRSPG